MLIFVFSLTQEEVIVSGQNGCVRNGRWGGEHISLAIEDNTARFEYDCAHGTIDQAIKVDSQGRFKITGTHTPEHGGPATKGEKTSDRPALYTGQITGEKMDIRIILTDTNEKIGVFTLVYGRKPNLYKCK